MSGKILDAEAQATVDKLLTEGRLIEDRHEIDNLGMVFFNCPLVATFVEAPHLADLELSDKVKSSEESLDDDDDDDDDEDEDEDDYEEKDPDWQYGGVCYPYYEGCSIHALQSSEGVRAWAISVMDGCHQGTTVYAGVAPLFNLSEVIDYCETRAKEFKRWELIVDEPSDEAAQIEEELVRRIGSKRSEYASQLSHLGVIEVPTDVLVKALGLDPSDLSGDFKRE